MDKTYMKKALKLAEKGMGRVNPNPLVGAIIVKDGRIIGEGYHEQYGQPHAEINALNNAIEDVQGATMYVTLEPCSHYGKTPPCVKEIIENKISRVVIGMLDVNPLVCGNGVTTLKNTGIEVTIGVLEDECRKLNEVFIKYITKQEPFVVLKTAMTLDGKIASSSGESKWISGELARQQVHNLRNELTAIMIGINTVLLDNPELTCRIENGRDPIRIIVDSKLRIPKECKVLKTANKIKTIVATTENVNPLTVKELEKCGAYIIKTSPIKDRVNLKELMKKLAELNIDSILLEGGSNLNYSSLESRIVDKVKIYIAPIIIGGDKSRTAVDGKGIEKINDAFKIDKLSTSIVGEDILFEGYIESEVD